MVKEKKKDEVVKEPPIAPIPDEAMALRLEAASERLELANKRFEQLQALAGEAKIQESLGGQAEAGQEPKKEEVSDKDYADKVMGGEVPDEKQ